MLDYLGESNARFHVYKLHTQVTLPLFELLIMLIVPREQCNLWPLNKPMDLLKTSNLTHLRLCSRRYCRLF